MNREMSWVLKVNGQNDLWHTICILIKEKQGGLFMKISRLIKYLEFLLLLLAVTSLIASSHVASSQIDLNSSNSLRESGKFDVSFIADPNPFDALTVLTVFTTEDGIGSIIVRDKYDNIVNNLYSGMFKRGYNNIVWDGTDNSGLNLPVGHYTCELIFGNRYTSRTIILILK